MMTRPTLVKIVFLKAPPDHVWKFLAEADKLGAWLRRGGVN